MGKVFIKIIGGSVYSIDGYETDVEIDDEGNNVKMCFKSQEQLYERRKTVQDTGNTNHQEDYQKE